MTKNRFRLALRVVPIIVAVVLLKFLVHNNDMEFLALSSLFTAVISANIFLIGFLLSGVMSDYKESEKIPSDIASSIETIADEGKILFSKDRAMGKSFVGYCSKLLVDIMEWFENKKRTGAVMGDLEKMNEYFITMEKHILPNYIVRMKGEQHNIRRLINRAHTIKDTDFVGTGYTIAEIITFIMVIGFIFMKMEPFYESLFFVCFVSFMLIYMIMFIKDLDNPFGYGKNGAVEEVSLKPFRQAEKRLEDWLGKNK